MRYPAGPDGMDFSAPRLPAPLHLAVALWRAKGLARDDKLALARFSTTARWAGWQLHTDCSVAELLARWDQTPRLTALMWRPLCIAALNTPPERASAQVFLNVLRDSLGARRAASDMLIPRVDLSDLLPRRAGQFVASNGGTVHLGASAELGRTDGAWEVVAQAVRTRHDAVVVAVPPNHAARLLDGLGDELAPLRAQLRGFEYEPIATCYLQYDAGVALAHPFLALQDDPAREEWGQFVFDRGQLDARHAGMLSVVVSAAADAAALPQDQLAQRIAAQLARAFARPELARPVWHKTITEKRATFACTPGLNRPDNATALAGLVLAGDYTAGPYPATLESAIASGTKAAALALE
jgi:squalene-associated FAD-dependent desaturase